MESTENLRAFARSVVGRVAALEPGDRLRTRESPAAYAHADEITQPATRLADIVSPDFLFERALHETAAQEGRDPLSAHRWLREFARRVRSGTAAEWLDTAVAAFVERDYAGAERAALAAAAEGERRAEEGPAPLLQVIGDADGTIRANVARQRAARLLAGDAQWLQAKPWDARQSYRAASRLVAQSDTAAWVEIEGRLCQLLEEPARKLGEALRQREEIAAVCALRLGADDRRTLAAQSWVAWEHELVNELPQAEKQLLEIHATRTKRLGPEDPDTARSLYEIGRLRAAQKYTVWAVPPAREALEIRRRVLAPSHPAILQSLRQVAAAWRAHGQVDRAEESLRAALALSERLFGPQHVETAHPAFALVELLIGDRRAAEAEPLYRRGLAIEDLERNPDDDAPSTEHEFFELFLAGLGKPLEYEAFLRQGLADSESEFGPEHAEVARSLVTLAQLLRKLGDGSEHVAPGVIPGLVDPDAPLAPPSEAPVARPEEGPRIQEASALLRRALAMCDRLLGDEPEAVPDLEERRTLLRVQVECLADVDALTAEEVAEAEHLLYRWTESQGRLLKTELDLEERRRGPLHPDVANRLEAYGLFVASWKKPMEAEPFLVRAFEIRERALELEDPALLHSFDFLVRWFEARGALAEAEALIRRLLAKPEAAPNRHFTARPRLLTQLATILHEEGRPAEADPLYREAQAARENPLSSRLDVQDALTYADFLRMEGRPAEAVPIYRWAEMPSGRLAEVLEDAGEFAEAEALLQKEMDLLPPPSEEGNLAGDRRRMMQGILGVLRARQGRYAEARDLLAAAVFPADEVRPEPPPRRRRAAFALYDAEPRLPTGPVPTSLAEYRQKQEALSSTARFAKYRAETNAALAREAAAVPQNVARKR
ncbi:MAG TPA: tetratricopeptide repeat protein [Chthoniobacteraceae bacterium]|nr:tetratricopeptide repeat protein [Chthoniobacteraceae bacterium]